jgi:Na+-driven multidrug efflux pump
MTKKIIFTLIWAGLGFFIVSVIMSFSAPFLLHWLGPVDDHTSTSVKLAYTFLPMVMIVVPVLLLVLGFLGKLPGTKLESGSK